MNSLDCKALLDDLERTLALREPVFDDPATAALIAALPELIAVARAAEAFFIDSGMEEGVALGDALRDLTNLRREALPPMAQAPGLPRLKAGML